MCAGERSEYPARSRGRWIISRLSRPRAGTEPSIFLFPPIRPLKRRRATRPLRSSPSPSFFISFFFCLVEGFPLALSDIPRLRERERERERRRTLGWALSILSRESRGIHPVGREMHAPRCRGSSPSPPWSADWWNSLRAGVDLLFANGRNVRIFITSISSPFWSTGLFYSPHYCI